MQQGDPGSEVLTMDSVFQFVSSRNKVIRPQVFHSNDSKTSRSSFSIFGSRPTSSEVCNLVHTASGPRISHKTRVNNSINLLGDSQPTASIRQRKGLATLQPKVSRPGKNNSVGFERIRRPGSSSLNAPQTLRAAIRGQRAQSIAITKTISAFKQASRRSLDRAEGRLASLGASDCWRQTCDRCQFARLAVLQIAPRSLSDRCEKLRQPT